MHPEQPGEGGRTGNWPALTLRAVLETAIVAAGAVVGPLLACIRTRPCGGEVLPTDSASPPLDGSGSSATSGRITSRRRRPMASSGRSPL